MASPTGRCPKVDAAYKSDCPGSDTLGAEKIKAPDAHACFTNTHTGAFERGTMSWALTVPCGVGGCAAGRAPPHALQAILRGKGECLWKEDGQQGMYHGERGRAPPHALQAILRGKGECLWKEDGQQGLYQEEQVRDPPHALQAFREKGECLREENKWPERTVICGAREAPLMPHERFLEEKVGSYGKGMAGKDLNMKSEGDSAHAHVSGYGKRKS
eukprot:1149142-Pelagomonas_calceolata.AAC.4